MLNACFCHLQSSLLNYFCLYFFTHQVWFNSASQFTLNVIQSNYFFKICQNREASMLRRLNVVTCSYITWYIWGCIIKKFCFWENDSTSTNFQPIIPLWYQYVKICCESRNINLESVHHLSYIISLYVYLYLFIYPHLSPSICYCKIVLRNINWSHNFPR